MLSGTSAFVTVKDGTKLTRGTIRKPFSAKGLKLESVSSKDITRPEEAYQIAITGGT